MGVEVTRAEWFYRCETLSNTRKDNILNPEQERSSEKKKRVKIENCRVKGKKKPLLTHNNIYEIRAEFEEQVRITKKRE